MSVFLDTHRLVHHIGSNQIILSGLLGFLGFFFLALGLISQYSGRSDYSVPYLVLGIVHLSGSIISGRVYLRRKKELGQTFEW